MSTMPSTLKMKLERMGRLSEEFHKESDRGCAVLVMCMLEEQLHDMIRSRLPNPEAKLGRFAPRGSLAIAIDNSVLIGLLTERQANVFRALAEVRNKFAHGVFEGRTFKSPEVDAIVGRIEPAVDLPDVKKEMYGDTPRKLFLGHAGALATIMMVKTLYMERLPLAPEFVRPDEMPNPA